MAKRTAESPETARKNGAAQRKTNAATTGYSVPALEKGLDILELLAHESEGLSKTQISRELNRTVSEIFRMLVCLERRGYIAQLGGDRFGLTLKLFKLVQEHPPTERLIATALPVMHRLARETLQSCHMGVLDESRVVILAQVNAPTSIGFYVKLGSTVDIMEAASGYVLLANMPEAQCVHVLEEWNKATGRKPPRDVQVHLARIRRTGYEKRASYLVRGVMNISFPILDGRGIAVAALTVPFIAQTGASSTEAKVVDALRAGAQEISAALGYGDAS